MMSHETLTLSRMEKNDDKRQQLIRDVLPFAGAHADGVVVDDVVVDDVTADDVAADAMRAWRQLAAHLNPLIGEAGFCALYGRAQRLSAQEEVGERLAASQGARTIEALLATLADSLAALDAQTVHSSCSALLDTFTRLLSGLIGEALTTRLLNTAWADRPDRKST